MTDTVLKLSASFFLIVSGLCGAVVIWNILRNRNNP